jgi:hypothetical protein
MGGVGDQGDPEHDAAGQRRDRDARGLRAAEHQQHYRQQYPGHQALGLRPSSSW